MAGQQQHGRKPFNGPQVDAERAETGAETPGTRRHSRAPNIRAGASTGPRVTNLVPQVRPFDAYAPGSRPRNIAAPRLTADTGETTTIPRQTNGAFRTASAAPPAPNAPTREKRASEGVSSPHMRVTLPQEIHGDPGSLGGQMRRRRTSTARPVRQEDTALVTQQTLIMNALEIVIEDARVATAEVPALRDPADMALVDADTAPRIPVTVVPAGAMAPTPMWLRTRRSGQRSLLAGFVTCLITIGLIFGVLLVANPLGATALPFGLLAARNANNSATGDPTGPWDAQAGAVLGLGGGAGPGVKAPGSAGLPAGNNTGDGGAQTSSAAPASNTGISAAPVRPWPPRWAYMYVPGHPSFKVNRPANGYYWWAFGQCTWWAQYKHQSENLRHMGNARYWAAGAAARGYHVGRTPVAGSTVVFQPGVEGAGGAGHVAHVERVYPGGWFLVSEMNFYWNGGGWGRVSYRFAYARSGVSFIY